MTFGAGLTVFAMAVPVVVYVGVLVNRHIVRGEPWSLRSTRTVAVALVAFVAVVMTPAIVGAFARSFGTQTTMMAIVVATLVGVAVLVAPWSRRDLTRPEQPGR